MSFIFGGNTGIKSPQELKEKRDLTRALVARTMGQQPKDLWSGLNFLAGAIGSRVQESKFDKMETEGRAGATGKFNALIGTLGSKSGAPSITPASYSPEEQTGMPGLKKALLNTIAGPESGGDYGTIYGGGKVTSYADHPRQSVPILRGPNVGKTSSAAGKYQFLAPTWDAQKQKLNLPDFSPESQDKAAWDLAATTYKAKTGQDLETVLASGDPQAIAGVGEVLKGVWTSLPGGIEQGIDGNGFVNQFNKNLGGGTQPVQVAQAGNGLDPRLLEAMSDPWMNEGQQGLIKALLQQQLEATDPKNKLEVRKLEAEINALENPKPKYDYQKLDDGTVVRTNEQGGPVEPVYKGGPKTTDDIAEYNFYVEQAKAAGQTPLPFDQFQQSMKKAGATSINMATGEPGDSKLRGKLQEKEAEQWSGYQATAAQSAAISQQLDVLDELGKMAPQGALQGRLAQAFPGFSSAGDAFMSIATRIAPSFRVPGSGSQSDIEYNGFLNSLPRLQTSPGGNQIISATLRAKASIELERGAIVDRYSNGDITAPEARRQMAALNKRSIMTPELQAVINANTQGAAGKGDKQAPSAPAADGWITLPDGTQIREKK